LVTQLFGPGVLVSSTYTPSTLTYTSALSSAANKALVRIGGNARAQGAGTAALFQLRRDGSAVLASGYCAGAANIRTQILMEALDTPNKLNTAYGAYLASSDNTTAINFPESPSNPQGGIIVEELMG
jgi:hypothetical protein